MNNMNMIIVTGEKGCKVHHIGRVLATLPSVHWYSDEQNGKQPWNLASAKTSDIRQRKIAPKHFDRILPNGDRLPPMWDLLKNYFPSQDEYLRAIFFPALEKARRQTSKTLVFTSHLPPFYLRQYFGTIPTINVLYDAKRAVKRRLSTSANFPGYYRLKGIVPEDNQFLKYLEALKKQKKDFTQKDLWAQKRMKSFWKDEYLEEYESHLMNEMTKNLEIRKMPFDNVCNVDMDNVDWKKVKGFLFRDKPVPKIINVDSLPQRIPN